MQPIVISHTIQEFGGIRYYFCGRYFQRKGVRLHIQVWEYHNGPIPEGHCIHHKYGSHRNNVEDLECLTYPEHMGDRHGEAAGDRGKQYLDNRALVAAAAWHKSEDGKRWHEENYQKHVRHIQQKRVELVCKECGQKFTASYMRRTEAKFCGGTCKARALRRRRKDARTA